MNWKSASLAQLYCIAYADEMALPSDQRKAAEEILRRLRRKRKNRAARLKALGNAVDPLQIYPIMYAIKLIDERIGS